MYILRICLFAFGLLGIIAGVQARDYHYSDAHLHFVDFFQESDGMDKLIEAMDKGKIDHVLITGIPVAKKWHENEPKRPRYFAGDDAPVYWYSATDVLVAAALDKLDEKQRNRFHPFMSGFNPNDKNAEAHIRRMLELKPGFWQGLGEIFTRHGEVTALTEGDTPRANNEALTKVYNLAAELDLPVMLHSDITSKREPNPLYLEELEQPLRNHPRTRFIWAHAGTSMDVHRYQEKLEFLLPTVKRLLDTYPNLYIDLSWTMLQPYLLNDEGKPDPGWVNLIERHPTRFFLGSDVVGHFDNLGESMAAFVPFLDALSETVAHQVARNNFLAILPQKRRKEIR